VKGLLPIPDYTGELWRRSHLTGDWGGTRAQLANELFSSLDWAPTLLAAAGEPNVKEKMLQGYEAAGRTFKLHLDGFNQLLLTGQSPKSARREFFYFNDDGDLVALRFENWKAVFMEQRMPGTLAVWAEPFTALRVPKLYDLHADPYEQADITSNTYYQWLTSSSPPARSPSSSSRRSGTSRPASARRASRSTRRWKSCGRTSAVSDGEIHRITCSPTRSRFP
jgi:hypothetical protein